MELLPCFCPISVLILLGAYLAYQPLLKKYFSRPVKNKSPDDTLPDAPNS